MCTPGHNAGSSSGGRQEGQMASDERGGGEEIQYIINSFELQPESQMMLLLDFKDTATD